MAVTETAAKRSEDGSRRRILTVARRHFATAGFDGASTRAIAAEAGVAQPLLLYHFRSKDALWRAVMDDLFEGLDERMARALEGADEAPPATQLMKAVSAFVQLCAEDADLHRIMTIEGRCETERLRWLVERHLRRNYRQTCDLIRRGQDAGTVRPGDPTLLYYTFIAIAGTAFSLAPEIGLLSGDAQSIEPATITALIRSLLIVET